MKTVKSCTKCQNIKYLDEFYWANKSKTILASACKQCCKKESVQNRKKDPLRKIKQQAYAKKNPDKLKNNQLKTTYGITLIQYQTLLKKQNNVCAICENEETVIWNNKPNYLCVDHCHSTKKIRGILCRDCNAALGKFQDSPDLLRKAATYLENANA